MSSTRTIWKFRLPKADVFSLSLPSGAVFLDVQRQRELPVAWFLVDSERETEKRSFVLVGTGKPIPEAHRLAYLGTFLMLDDQVTVPLFEVKE